MSREEEGKGPRGINVLLALWVAAGLLSLSAQFAGTLLGNTRLFVLGCVFTPVVIFCLLSGLWLAPYRVKKGGAN